MAFVPVSVRPLAVTVLPVPTLAVSKLAVPVHATTSPPSAPVTVQLVSVAAVVPSNDLVRRRDRRRDCQPR